MAAGPSTPAAPTAFPWRAVAPADTVVRCPLLSTPAASPLSISSRRASLSCWSEFKLAGSNNRRALASRRHLASLRGGLAGPDGAGASREGGGWAAGSVADSGGSAWSAPSSRPLPKPAPARTPPRKPPRPEDDAAPSPRGRAATAPPCLCPCSLCRPSSAAGAPFALSVACARALFSSVAAPSDPAPPLGAAASAGASPAPATTPDPRGAAASGFAPPSTPALTPTAAGRGALLVSTSGSLDGAPAREVAGGGGPGTADRPAASTPAPGRPTPPDGAVDALATAPTSDLEAPLVATCEGGVGK